jgi:hypothetical protein
MASLGPKWRKIVNFRSFLTLSAAKPNVEKSSEWEANILQNVYLMYLVWVCSTKCWLSTVSNPTLGADVMSILRYFDHLARRRTRYVQWKPPCIRLFFNQTRYWRGQATIRRLVVVLALACCQKGGLAGDGAGGVIVLLFSAARCLCTQQAAVVATGYQYELLLLVE